MRKLTPVQFKPWMLPLLVAAISVPIVAGFAIGGPGVGTAMGALYGPVSRLIPLPEPLSGAAFGLAVWAGNYLGLLPALGLLRPATEHPSRRVGLMLAAHLVWGAAAGTALALVRAPEDGSE